LTVCRVEDLISINPSGYSGVNMGKAFTAYMTGGAWLCLGLDFVGWVLLLAGVASMQQACGGSGANALNGVENGGGAGYNGPVPCDSFFGYTYVLCACTSTVE